jgi:hypothetical protein
MPPTVLFLILLVLHVSILLSAVHVLKGDHLKTTFSVTISFYKIVNIIFKMMSNIYFLLSMNNNRTCADHWKIFLVLKNDIFVRRLSELVYEGKYMQANSLPQLFNMTWSAKKYWFLLYFLFLVLLQKWLKPEIVNA